MAPARPVRPPLAIAHRGEPVGHPENTVAGFLAAVAMGADMVEIDLRITADGVVVVHHDRTLEREWGERRAVDEVGLDEVAALVHRGGGGEAVPTLEQVLAEVTCPLMVDFTGPEVVGGAVSAVRAAGAFGRCLFVSGHLEALARVRALAPEARIGVTWTAEEQPAPAVLAGLGAECWNPMWIRVTPSAVDAMHSAGYRVTCWTVDEEADMALVIEAGVDGVVSNRIARLRAVLDAGGAPAGPG